MRKLMLIALLVVNVVLLGALALTLAKPPTANAQAMGLSGNFLMVSGESMGTNSDTVYIVDLAKREMHSLRYGRSTNDITHLGSRDLSRDIGGATAGTGNTAPKRGKLR